ncbi:thioredoxin family protein [Thalassobacillus devorans]|uniref:Thioredoxin family protein n=1 Tax=Thalassobacillus devorans TaxID=279813 RepID=A0ABQ1NXB8_9BACI|nr:glutaredoxin family protein [Thalassobacillus devorans]NIK28944.1 glutaredoxin [Thalassobacillus devorans]GGC82372.1 thioredoxin family protein [Thalassobacillus devorans]
MKEVILYSKENCCLCEDAKELLNMLKKDYNFTVLEKDIYKDDTLLEKYQFEIPVVRIDEEELNCEQIDVFSLRERLQEK